MKEYLKKIGYQAKNTSIRWKLSLGDFWLGKYVVTQELWNVVMGNNTSTIQQQRDYPVVNISWNDCIQFIDKIQSKTGLKLCLPTLSQWMYAACGGVLSSNYKYSGGNNLSNVGWYSRNSGGSVHPVGQKRANELGLYDMSGNVWEWNKTVNEDFDSKTKANFLEECYFLCGGDYSSSADSCKTFYYINDEADRKTDRYGFRLALLNDDMRNK